MQFCSHRLLDNGLFADLSLNLLSFLNFIVLQAFPGVHDEVLKSSDGLSQTYRQHRNPDVSYPLLEMGLRLLFLWVALVQSPDLSLVLTGPMSEVTELKAMVAESGPWFLGL